MTEQEIRFCTTSDGVRIAYATMGEGSPPLVFVSNWISPFKYVEYDPAVASLSRELASHFQIVLFDRRGTGMSDREVHDFSRSALVKDLEAVIDHVTLRRVALWGVDNIAGPTAIEYAHRHPDRVSHLALLGCCARGRDIRRDDADALIQILRKGWDVAPEMFATLAMPGVQPTTARAFYTALRESCSGESAAAQIEAELEEDVTDLLHEIKTPTLVLHARQDRSVPFALGRELASLLPNARLLPLDWEIHWDPGNLAPLTKAIVEFLAPAGAGKKGLDATPSALATILFTDIEGSTALTERLGDARAQELRRAHDTIVREALKGCGGSETKHTGDGIMASFPSASRAIECAVAVQRAIAEREDETLRVRIGLNAGEPVAEEADLFGTAVNLARRICDEAEPGQILVSDVVHQLSAGKGFTFADNGEATLKGFEKPVRLHEVRWRDD